MGRMKTSTSPSGAAALPTLSMQSLQRFDNLTEIVLAASATASISAKN